MKAVESGDPFELVGTGYPVPDPEAADRDTTRCLIEEYALSGFSASEILRLFETPMYVYPHAIYRRRGAGFVQELIGTVFGSRR